MFNDTPAQKCIIYRVSDKWYFQKGLNDKYVYIKNPQDYKHRVKSCAVITVIMILNV